ncbi:MAG: prepilin-type N-terminal cleavage/methylation domain-containing protein [Candidatus Methylomirabilales bacterium]
MNRALDARGMSLIEVLIAAAILAVSLVSLLSAFPTAYVNVVVGGGKSKVTAYAQQKMEQVKNQPFNPGPVNQTDTPEPGYTRTWTITQEPGTSAPNRLARVTVNVTWRGSRLQNVTFETMRAE